MKVLASLRPTGVETSLYRMGVQVSVDGCVFHHLVCIANEDAGSQPSLTEGRLETGARVEIAPDVTINLFDIVKRQ